MVIVCGSQLVSEIYEKHIDNFINVFFSYVTEYKYGNICNKMLKYK